MSSCGEGLRAAGAAGFGATAAGFGASTTGAGASVGGASPGRPWLKLCLTLPVSTVRLRPSGGRVPSFGFSVWSAILILRQIFFSRERPQGGFSAFRTTIGASKSPPALKRVLDTRSGGGIGQGDMYHILAPECHRQDSAIEREYHPPGVAPTDAPRLVERAIAVVARVSSVDEQMDLARSRRIFDAVGAGDQVAGPRFHAEPVERRLAERSLGALAEIGGDGYVVDLERALERGFELALGVGRVELGAADGNPCAAARSAGADVG